MTELVLPQHTNAYGTCFGGTILSWIDIAAGICARRHAGAQAVTVAFDDVHFITPIRLGDIVNIAARICHAGRTSMEIRVEVWRERHDAQREHANTAYVVFVAVDAGGRPLPVPGVVLDNDQDRARFDDAVERRQLRMAKARRTAPR
ncbi:MAG: acyl-CoA thioesterase [Deltaproteobacteria bacterium]|nr:acyl-CoA thioesterase [Deltaproteobacteria bacterium]